jgi:hypothetical protein
VVGRNLAEERNGQGTRPPLRRCIDWRRLGAETDGYAGKRTANSKIYPIVTAIADIVALENSRYDDVIGATSITCSKRPHSFIPIGRRFPS